MAKFGYSRLEKNVIWALRRAAGPMVLKEVVKACELEPGWNDQIGEALKRLSSDGLVQEFHVRASRRYGPARTSYGLTLAGYQIEFAEVQ